jgi:23S rRNA (pseudouridine1915-N3)-methyltransferase
MALRLVTIGRPSTPWADAIEAYRRRAVPPWDWEWTVLKADRAGSTEVRRRREAEAVLALRRDRDHLIALDERGTELSTRDLHDRLAALMAVGRSPLLAVGGTDGFDPAVREAADFVWSLSRLTWPHDLAAVLVAEQLYRVSAIDRGHPYHRE